VSEEWHMRHHLVIDELVFGRYLNDTVKHHYPAKILILEDDQALMLGLAVE
jgi:hypothetical protein